SSKVACSPILIDDKLLCVYRNGQCKVIAADNGNITDVFNIGSPVLSAWIDGSSIAGYTATKKFTWSGTDIVIKDLLKNIVAGGPGVIKTKDNRVRTPNSEGRYDIELGRLTEDITAMPLLWNNHAVCPVGNKMVILGAHGFTITSPKPMLAPIIMGDILIIASSDGHVRYLKK
ncbi:MAG: hypothetical protein HRU15_09355, partial [Planctomycetes bacterium]|nr:hypothetical protein [Planctomycetota bacterium]